jgi:hypothetical protein
MPAPEIGTGNLQIFLAYPAFPEGFLGKLQLTAGPDSWEAEIVGGYHGVSSA